MLTTLRYSLLHGDNDPHGTGALSEAPVLFYTGNLIVQTEMLFSSRVRYEKTHFVNDSLKFSLATVNSRRHRGHVDEPVS